LCLDFNCAMYAVLRQQPPFVLAEKERWEARFCADIAAYMKRVIELAAPSVGVVVSCDGVVCAAKRRQQRLRRFKGPWAAEQEARLLGKGSKEAKWDQNALTPGTAFMEKLGEVLTTAGATVGRELGLTVRVSTTAEPGEGEHKLLAEMRRVRPASCAIYGLDADLILLSLLLVAETGASVYLVREAQEFEAGASGDEWRTLAVKSLAEVLTISPAQIRDFVALMSLLGNDFLPRPLTRTVRDNGIAGLLETLRTSVWADGARVVREDGALSREGLLRVLRAWADTEAADMLRAVRGAQKAQERRVFPRPGEDARLAEWNAQPARWGTACQILAEDTLIPDWRDWYKENWHAGDGRAYLEGVAWVWDYYSGSGRAVDLGWCYDAHLPPLWCDLVGLLDIDTGETVGAPEVKWNTPLPAWVHLLSVLPAASVRRLLAPQRQRLMGKEPLFWPSSWSLFDVGRTQMWECEPLIPLLPEGLLRSWTVS
jgi:5'-3' exonuclease